jgi:hypothetical protein
VTAVKPNDMSDCTCGNGFLQVWSDKTTTPFFLAMSLQYGPVGILSNLCKGFQNSRFYEHVTVLDVNPSLASRCSCSTIQRKKETVPILFGTRIAL